MMNDSAELCDSVNGTSACANVSFPDYDAADAKFFTHVFPAVYGILCAVGVIANALVIYAVATCKKKLVSDVYVLNLAVADLLFLLVMPFNIHQLVWERQWIFGAFMYTAIVHPMSENRTIRWTIIINFLVWMGSFLLTIPVMIYAKVISKDNSSICMIYLDGPRDMYWYTLYQSTLGFIVPLIIISTFYSLTLYHVFQSMRRVKRKQSLWAKRATKMVIMVIALFLLCWTPYHVIQVINLGIQEPTPAFVYAYNISICLSYSHSCINPLMLLIFAQNYRERLCRRCDTPSNLSKATVKTEGCSSISPNTTHRSTIL
ncbi:Melanin-concentrating hormone receptor 2 [Bagarius yarrelli]|uniref:Melanin-concentrating hormone receptor 2 n=1 Tax=Bagarius yarrelli TaxID=175774 RepID=A0A556V571_BAGYA|nr:Melanin-concentrating hormone receptor 2 [Bagarius yarrelli]